MMRKRGIVGEDSRAFKKSAEISLLWKWLRVAEDIDVWVWHIWFDMPIVDSLFKATPVGQDGS